MKPHRKCHGKNFPLVLALVASTVGLFLPQPVEAGSFVPTGSLATPRVGFTATLLPSGKVLVTGGYDGTNQLALAELYDAATGNWTATGAMQSRRSVHTATLLPNGKVLVVGGYDGTNTVASAELYDPDTSTWTATGSLHARRNLHTASLLPDGKVLIAGGADDSTQLDSAELYETTTGSWALTGSMTGSRASHTATLLPNGRVLAVGGEGIASPWSGEIYDPTTYTWAATGDMSDPRSEHTATLLPNGKVLVAGGGWYSPFFGYTSIAATELYDPTSGTWTSTSLLTGSRYGHTATLLPNGQVLVAGGAYQGFGAWTLSSAELYDPAFGTWSPAGNMTVSRLYHSATLLPRGRVLIAAGFNHSAEDLSSAELYGALSSASPQPPTLTSAKVLANGTFQFSFTNPPGGTFYVLATTFPTLPSSEWMMLGVTEIAPGQFQFTDTHATNYAKRFYRTRSP